MTIERRVSWGKRTARPEGLRTVAADHELARALTDGSGAPTTVAAGDMLRTLGGRGAAAGDEVVAAPLDLIEVHLDGRRAPAAVAHIMVRTDRWRGGPLRGPVVMVMNAEFMGEWDVAPRSHPNDGRVEVLSCGAGFGPRQRLEARRRLVTATHVPHPEITTRSVERASWTFERPMVVVADGLRLGRARSIDIVVRPDAAILYL